MALDLFANYERASNNSVFYRPISSVAHNVLYKIVDLENPELELIEYYQAEYSLDNSSQKFPMIDLQLCKEYARTVPATYTITVFISSLDPVEYYGTITLSAKYVSSLPEANFVVYPTLRINEQNGTITTLNSTNYYQSSGAYFYGEGHTEIVNLSSNFATAKWYVGNPLSAVEGNQSVFPVVSLPGNKTATVSLTSSPAQQSEYDVNLRIVNSEISETGPIYTYDDFTGVKSFYPFFCSTRHISNSASELNSILRSPIEIKPYPTIYDYSIVSELSGSPISLPFDFSNQRFLARVQKIPGIFNFLTEPFYATQWKLESVADTQEPNPDWSNITPMYPAITGYSFPLSYYNQNNIDDFLFKCSAGFDTTVTTSVSVFKSTEINLPPYDWLCRTTALPLSTDEVVAGMPVGRFYTSNYYYLTGEEVKFYNITEERSNITITSVVLSSDRLENSLVFSPYEKVKTAQYDDIGIVNLSATINFLDKNGQPQTVTTIVNNFIEIVSEYDEVLESSYRSNDATPSSLIQTYPRISPNEWVTEDNINSIFYKLNDSLEELRDFAKSYNTENNIIGRLGPIPIPEGSCIGKYCLDWKWVSRTCENSVTFTTWENTKCSGDKAATWAGEECNLINELGCKRNDYWLVPTIEPNEFNDWSCIDEEETCKYIGIQKLKNLDKLIVAYKTELHLLDNDYEATLLNKHFFVDEVFNFFSISGIAKTTDDRIAVLDSTLSRVSVFSIDEESKFTLFSTWGRYGLSNSKTGFNKPQDIHIDHHNNVWICDTGNNCVKKLTITGRHIATVQNDKFEDNAPISICVDADDMLHCLTKNSSIYVFDKDGNFSFEYATPEGIAGVKINTNYNKEAVYITYYNGVLKYFKTGVLSHYIINDYLCSENGTVLQKFSSIIQDEHRNIYVTLNNTILKILDRMVIEDSSFEGYSAIRNLWSINSILIDKEEYIQPWVYLRSFHRLWDNVELFRNSLFYEVEGCKSFQEPVYAKEDLILGQNEIVTNATINRLSEQLWTNLQSIAKYFDPTCKN